MSAKKLGVITVASVCMITASIALAQVLRQDYEMEFNVGRDEYTVNGQTKQFDVNSENLPFIEEGTGKLQMPLRLVIEEMGGSLKWNETDKSIEINYKDRILKVYADSNKASINGYSIELKSIPKSVNGCLYVNADFIRDNFGTEIQWVGDKKQIIMKTEIAMRPSVNINKIEYNEGNLDYSIEIPVITGLNDKNFEKELNNSFYQNKMEEVKIFAKKAKAEDTAENAMKFIWKSTCTAHYRSGQFISIESKGTMLDPTEYSEIKNVKEVFNIDLQAQKKLVLSELFKNNKYNDVITKEINSVIKSDPNKYGNNEIDKISGEELFYMTDNEMVIQVSDKDKLIDEDFKIPYVELKKQFKSSYDFFIYMKK